MRTNLSFRIWIFRIVILPRFGIHLDIRRKINRKL